jgi:RluA family pseudouridine synthase
MPFIMISISDALLYEKDSCLVVNKPPGLLTQAPPGIDSLEVQLRAFFQQREPAAKHVYVGLPHRLDRPVSGAIAVARDVYTTRDLSRQFEERRVAKSYWAFVEHAVEPAEGTWTDYLYKVHGVAQAKVVDKDDPDAKLAILHYRVLTVNEAGSWLEIALETGRTHQIRVQAASRGHPVLGDFQYGSQRLFGEPHDDVRMRPIALHARHLAFSHPATREEVDVLAPPHAAWETIGIPLQLFQHGQSLPSSRLSCRTIRPSTM